MRESGEKERSLYRSRRGGSAAVARACWSEKNGGSVTRSSVVKTWALRPVSAAHVRHAGAGTLRVVPKSFGCLTVISTLPGKRAKAWQRASPNLRQDGTEKGTLTVHRRHPAAARHVPRVGHVRGRPGPWQGRGGGSGQPGEGSGGEKCRIFPRAREISYLLEPCQRCF